MARGGRREAAHEASGGGARGVGRRALGVGRRRTRRREMTPVIIHVTDEASSFRCGLE
ncbi:unnamed protein product [Spirodela intermedia]|uniref:Uncharacterized protein n=1 Tax=Spirodela intermedia TaxID=51605 RepID=A0A7I8JTP3_SPIIN|nr:unnamed protein product [Spirodela intermedia]CAA6673550.1 unnamed protein product [Spirodela intermedia]